MNPNDLSDDDQAKRQALRSRLKLGAFGALAVAIALTALAACQGPAQPHPGSSLPEQSAQAQSIAKARWGFDKPVLMVDAPGIKTAKAAMREGTCMIWRDGDIAADAWWRSLRARAGLYIDLHEMAHCQEEGTPGYARRKASVSAEAMAHAREVYADSMAFSAIAGPDPLKSFIPGFAKIKRVERDPHDSGLAAKCLAAQAGDTQASDEAKAQNCADLAAGLPVARMAKL